MAEEAPWVRIDRNRFETDEGTASLADLFRDAHSSSSITSCSAPRTWALPGLLGDRGWLQRLRRAPRAPRRRYDCCLARPDRRARPTNAGWAGRSRGRRRWTATSTTTSIRRSPRSRTRSGSVDYNYRTLGTTPSSEAGPEGSQDRRRTSLDFSGEFAAVRAGTDIPTYTLEAPGMSAFAFSGRRRLPYLLRLRTRPRRALGNGQAWLDQAPKGRNETGPWFGGSGDHQVDSR